MKREKRLTKREKKAANPRGTAAAAGGGDEQHIHCIACGRHIDVHEFDGANPGAMWINCQHRSTFPSCVECAPVTRERLAEHDRTGQPVKQAGAWH